MDKCLLLYNHDLVRELKKELVQFWIKMMNGIEGNFWASLRTRNLKLGHNVIRKLVGIFYKLDKVQKCQMNFIELRYIKRILV